MSIARLRTDLHIQRSIGNDGVAYYLIADQQSDEVLTFREEEMFLCNRLAECDDLDEIRTLFEAQFKKRLEREQLAGFVRYLAQKKLLADHPAPPASIWEGFHFKSPDTWPRWKFLNPSKFMVSLANRFKWCYTRPFLIASLAIFIVAFLVVVFNWKAVLKDLKTLVFPFNIFEMFAFMYLFVNAPGEIVRGITSSRFGGYCDEFGIWLSYNIMPRFYCLANVTDIPDRSLRSWALFSPSYYSILVGSIGVLVWKMSASVIFLHKWGLTIAFLSFIDSVMRLNFLWPSEGHYIVANYLAKDDFRQRATRSFTSFIFRDPIPTEPLSASDRRILIIYGFLTLLLTFPCVAILFYFIGKSLIATYAGIGASLWIGIVSVKYRKGISGLVKEINMAQWMKKTWLNTKKRKRFALWILIALIVLLLPYPYEAEGPFKVLPLERTELHALVSGEIKNVLVRENDIVNKGSVQAVLYQYEHQKNFDTAKANYDKAQQDLKLMINGPKPEEVKKAEEQVAMAKTQADFSRQEEVRLKHLYREGVIGQEEYEKAHGTAEVDANNLAVAIANLSLVKSGPRPEAIEAQRAVVRECEAKVVYYKQNLDHTMLVAPISGRVVTPSVESRVGQYLKEGDLFATYETLDEAHVEVQLPEPDVHEIAVGRKVRFRVEANPLKDFEGNVMLIAPVAIDTPNNGRVVRVKLRVSNSNQELKPNMSGAAKIWGGWRPVIIAFTKPVVRFVMIEVWSWFP